jgi:hypothetical protein
MKILYAITNYGKTLGNLSEWLIGHIHFVFDPVEKILRRYQPELNLEISNRMKKATSEQLYRLILIIWRYRFAEGSEDPVQ